MTTKESAENLFQGLERVNSEEKFLQTIQEVAISEVFENLCEINPKTRLDITSDESWKQYQSLFKRIFTPFDLERVPFKSTYVDFKMGIVEIKNKRIQERGRDGRSIEERIDHNTLEVSVAILDELPKGMTHLAVEKVDTMSIPFTKSDLREYIDGLTSIEFEENKPDADMLFDNLQNAIEIIDTKNEIDKRYVRRGTE